MSMIWLPKKELVVPLHSRVGVAGFFKLEAVRPDGRVRVLADWFPNLITDIGLNRMGQGSYLTACQVGSDNTAPNVADSGLAGYRAGTTTRQAESNGAQASPPYYGWKRITFRFAAGTASGNIAEVAIASAAAQAGSVNFSRALVLDEGGNPTTVTVLGDEVLDVTYELRNYPDLTEPTGTITVSGSGTHDYTLRAANVTSNSIWAYALGNQCGFWNINGIPLTVFNGTIGAITGAPSGSSAATGIGNAAYSNGSLQREGTGGFGLNQGNLSGGIRSVMFQTSLSRYQYQLTPNIMKDGTKTLSLTHRMSWTRYTP